jgi:hypothetical protein
VKVDEELLERENQNRLISKLRQAKHEQEENTLSGPLFKLSQVDIKNSK